MQKAHAPLKRIVALLSSVLVIGLATAARADDASRRFDGNWTTVLSCRNAEGALGYSFRFQSTVRENILHGEKGMKGQPGWLQIDGKISDDGSAEFYADGLVGAAPFAVGERPSGTEYGYHIDAKFSDFAGQGNRVEGRPCAVTFTKGIQGN